ncbi:MAG: Crossover junction endodeoxyribonuclease RuvC [Parcubacteria group bacterium GW2011_GWA1_47_11]|uniref:Crossover junction endodeoxyribonuclease RuvC n=1 Tax=Candidatus Yanofskybacteria bacterium RIFCSPHIGHO2_01_FULL_48_25b TaxID=1802672 RepID=A0A1F8EZY7_9BACT|nr:MAG: Crossover junction endodeoxyribonuclease RuvC [Parcubacteria group bacterium GW2011_GWA1_47_11]OGN06447.1 MAG: crossover junction endodeoxyribonuclease RuvC [Candidatus Yanofskybacteria bacterium RIFCSPHIGHO2_01_FULL_48_25b]
MIVIGIDPGTTRIGYGIIRNESSRLSYIAHGIITNGGKDKMLDFQATEKNLAALIKKHKPSMAGIEKLFFFKNQKTVMSVSEMRGVILLTLARHGLPVQEFTPLEVKRNVSAYGRAEKDQVERMVKALLKIRNLPGPDDAVDALAIAICCSNNIIS